MIGQSAVMPAGDYGVFGSFGGKMSALIKSKNRREVRVCNFIEVFRIIQRAFIVQHKNVGFL